MWDETWGAGSQRIRAFEPIRYRFESFTQLDHWYIVHSQTQGPSAAPALEAPSLRLQTLQPTNDVGTDS
jgi:hypothetical protein